MGRVMLVSTSWQGNEMALKGSPPPPEGPAPVAAGRLRDVRDDDVLDPLQLVNYHIINERAGKPGDEARPPTGGLPTSRASAWPPPPTRPVATRLPEVVEEKPTNTPVEVEVETGRTGLGSTSSPMGCRERRFSTVRGRQAAALSATEQVVDRGGRPPLAELTGRAIKVALVDPFSGEGQERSLRMGPSGTHPPASRSADSRL